MSTPEQEQQELEWIPRSMRDRLDACAVRISLKQWQALPLAARRELADLAESAMPASDYRAALGAALRAADAGELGPMRP